MDHLQYKGSAFTVESESVESDFSAPSSIVALVGRYLRRVSLWCILVLRIGCEDSSMSTVQLSAQG